MAISGDKQKRAVLLHNGGPEVDEIFGTLQDDDPKTKITKRPSRN